MSPITRNGSRRMSQCGGEVLNDSERKKHPSFYKRLIEKLSQTSISSFLCVLPLKKHF